MDESRQKEVSRVLDAVSTISDELWLIAVCVCGVLALILYHNWTAPALYEAHTSIHFEESTQPIHSLGLPNGFARKSFLDTQVEIIKSRTLAEAVVHELPWRGRELILQQVEARARRKAPGNPMPGAFVCDHLLRS